MSISSFEHREIDCGPPETKAECHLGTKIIGDVEFRAYRCTTGGRLSKRAKYALVVCMSCERSLYELPHRREAWYMDSDVAWHHQSCEGLTR